LHAIVLLKGPGTVVAEPGGDVIVNRSDSPALATAGTGDVLTGVTAAFLSKGLDAVSAACAAAVAHGRAGALVEHQAGLVAGDLLRTLPAALES
jgi:NAD(P)H-hydrate epimerase